MEMVTKAESMDAEPEEQVVVVVRDGDGGSRGREGGGGRGLRGGDGGGREGGGGICLCDERVIMQLCAGPFCLPIPTDAFVHTHVHIHTRVHRFIYIYMDTHAYTCSQRQHTHTHTHTPSQPLEAGQLLVTDLHTDTADARIASAFAKNPAVLSTNGFVLADDGALISCAQNPSLDRIFS